MLWLGRVSWPSRLLNSLKKRCAFPGSTAWQEGKTAAAFTISAALIEPLIFYRGNKPYRRIVALWRDRHYEYVGQKASRGFLLQYIEEKAERVANLYLSAN